MSASKNSSGMYREPSVEADLRRYCSTAPFSGVIAAVAAVVIMTRGSQQAAA